MITRQQVDEITDAFRFLWKEYATEDDEDLSRGAQELKESILKLVDRIDEVRA